MASSDRWLRRLTGSGLFWSTASPTGSGEAPTRSISTPQLLDLLVYLLERAGTLVMKDTLLDALWPDANVTENAVAQAVSELRRAIGDNVRAPRYIKTIARRGYRFIGAVERVGVSTHRDPEHAHVTGDHRARLRAPSPFWISRT